MRYLRPVSYTHLDVYKRQEPDGAVCRFGDDSAVAVGLGQTTVAALVYVLPVVALSLIHI